MNDIINLASARKLLYVNWALTNACNYSCAYCHDDLNSGNIIPPDDERLIIFINNMINKSNLNNRVLYVEFGGGQGEILHNS